MANVGMVGLGWWGQVLVNSVQGKSRKIKITKAAVRTPAKYKDYAASKGIELVASMDDLLADKSIDFIICATPHSQHADQIIAAARAGKPIFIEKPFTMTVKDAKRVLGEVEKAGIPVSVGFNRRFPPFVKEIQKKIESGELGTLLHLEMGMTAPMGLFTPKDNWRATAEEAPAGGLTGIGVHLLDSSIQLCGRIEEIMCYSVRRAVKIPIDDTTSCLMKMENGMTASWVSSIATSISYHLTLYGTGGIARISRRAMDKFEWWANPQDKPHGMDMKPKVKENSDFDMLKMELEAFADAASGKKPQPISNAEILHGVAAFEAVIASAKSGKPVKLKA